MKINIGFLSLLLAALFYATNDIIIRIVSSQLSTYQQLTIRCVVGFLFTLTIGLILKNKFNFGKGPKIYFLLYAISLPLAVIFFTIGISQAKIASVIFAYYSGTLLFSLCLGILLFKEKISLKKIISLIFVILGIIFLTFPFSIKEINLGFWAGLTSGIIAQISYSLSKHFSNKIDKIILMGVQMLGAIIIGSLLLGFTHQSFFPHASTTTLILCGISGILLVSTVYLTTLGFRKFDLHLGTIIISSELFLAPFFAFLLFKESLTIYEIIGGFLITLAIITPHIKWPKLIS